jgi:signal transduction histidine kinase/CheY-like chemotaxis protein
MGNPVPKTILPILLVCLVQMIDLPPAISNDVIKVGVYQNTPLTFIEKDGQVRGFFIDILNYVAEIEGWEIAYVPCLFPECLGNLQNRQIDLLGVIAYSEPRERLFDYTYESVFTNWGQIYTNKRSDIESMLDLNGKKVAVLQGDIYFEDLRELVHRFGMKCRFIEAFEYEDVLKLVELGRCQAGLVSQVYGVQHERSYGISKGSIVISPRKLYWATADGTHRDLLFKLDKHVRELKSAQQPIYQKMIDRWFGVGVKSAFGGWFVWIAVGFLTLFAIIFVANLVLRVKVRSRTKELLVKNEALMKEIKNRKQAEEALRDSEEKLARSKRMESLGLMAGGIAHDLNNILSGIVSYPDLLLMDLPEDSKLRKPIETIRKSGFRAADVVSDLLTVAKGVAIGKEVLSLNTIVDDYLKSPEHQKLQQAHPFINFTTELAPDLQDIDCSPNHMKKILMNLVDNASEAIEESGTVTISTKNRYVDEPLKGYEDVRIGEYALLCVSDNGVGISRENLERIFEPFFTKKVMGRRGTGLGLAVVWNTVQDHDGYINVKSDNTGSVFELYFPITREAALEARKEIPIEDHLGHGEKVLVVDDEENQREIACRMLNKLGYSAEAVSSGEEAVEYLKENTPDLIVLDMIMPKGMNGRQAYKEILKIRPGQKAVIASGYSETEDVKKAQSLGAGGFVKKPYTLEKIGIAIRKELNR